MRHACNRVCKRTLIASWSSVAVLWFEPSTQKLDEPGPHTLASFFASSASSPRSTMEDVAEATTEDVEAALGLVLGTACGASVWCFRDGPPLAPGEFLYVIPGLPSAGVVIAEDRHGAGGVYRLGGVTWEAGELLARWLCSSDAKATIGQPWSSVESAIELGAGVGLVSVALGLLLSLIHI